MYARVAIERVRKYEDCFRPLPLNANSNSNIFLRHKSRNKPRATRKGLGVIPILDLSLPISFSHLLHLVLLSLVPTTTTNCLASTTRNEVQYCCYRRCHCGWLHGGTACVLVYLSCPLACSTLTQRCSTCQWCNTRIPGGTLQAQAFSRRQAITIRWWSIIPRGGWQIVAIRWRQAIMIRWRPGTIRFLNV